jgi:hypothetical protein
LGYVPSMPYLVDVTGALLGVDAADALEDVFKRVASEAIGLAEPAPIVGSSFDVLRERLDRRTVAIGDWKHPNALVSVNGGEWDRGEVVTNLRQIEVLILALRAPILRTATSVKLNPTQQAGFDAEGVLGKARWVLEAFGGVNVTNNNKLVNDAASLRTAPVGTRRFFACRPSAWTFRASTKSVTAGTFTLSNDPDQEGIKLFEFHPSEGP